jgi:hypothetical protein
MRPAFGGKADIDQRCLPILIYEYTALKVPIRGGNSFSTRQRVLAVAKRLRLRVDADFARLLAQSARGATANEIQQPRPHR